jgi:hypothetical protein
MPAALSKRQQSGKFPARSLRFAFLIMLDASVMVKEHS